MSTRVSSHRKQFQIPHKPVAKVASLDTWGWGGFITHLVVAFGFLIFGLTHFAFASRQFGADSFTSNPKYEVTATVSGEMNWKDGVGTIKDTGTGQVYTLKDSDGLKTLWDSGVKNVSVRGRTTSNHMLTVENVSAP